jgi:DNA-binding beta-propeller fold protein YncE
MRGRLVSSLAVAFLALAATAGAHTHSSPIQVTIDAKIVVVNTDSNTLARLEFDGSWAGTLTHEQPVGSYPRTVALAGGYAFTANQKDDTVTRVAESNLGNPLSSGSLGFGCAPYGVAARPGANEIVVSCQGTSELLVLDFNLNVLSRIKLPWPGARAIAVSDSGNAYVTHFLTEEPGTDGHVSVVDLANRSVVSVFPLPADLETCETQNSGQGVLNLVSAIALVPAGAPAEVANQLWVGGVLQNNVSKGLFKRNAGLGKLAGATMFPFTYKPFPASGIGRDVFKASFHDIIRSAIYKLNALDGTKVGKIDIDEGTQGSDIAFSPDGTAAYIVDLGFNSYHVFSTERGQRPDDVTTLFAAPSRFGPGGAEGAGTSCVPEALASIVAEAPFRRKPQAQISVISGFDPARYDGANFVPVATGVDFDTVTYMTSGTSQMRQVPDGIGTGPIGVAVAPGGDAVFVANYLSRNVVVAAAAHPLDGGGNPTNFRCSNAPAKTCGTTNDCAGGNVVGFCNHPGGKACSKDADCAPGPGPCVLAAQCVPLVLADPVSTITGGLAADPLHPSLLDGKILFATAARDSSVPNTVGLDLAAPLFDNPKLVCLNDDSVSCSVKGHECDACQNNPAQRCTSPADCGGAACVGSGPQENPPRTCVSAPNKLCESNSDCPAGDECLPICRVSRSLPGEVVSTGHDASYVTCQTCHADFGGQDGRTWDFSQLGVSLRNTMDLRGRPGFAPGHCSNDASVECTFDAACGDGNFCQADDADVPPNIQGADRQRWFNPMMTVHWNGDRDEVEDFEFTFRSLQGAGDCDAAEDAVNTCMGALVQRSILTSMDPVDVNAELGAPNRNIHGIKDPSKIVGIRLTHLADFVYTLTDFVRNPNLPDDAAERGRRIFNDPQTKCVTCHSGGPQGKQFFTDKRGNPGFAAGQPSGAVFNNPFFRHDVGTGNLFDQANPGAIAQANQTWQNSRIPIPGDRDPLMDYVTPVMNDLWNTAPYLHDGSAHTLLDVVRPCDNSVDDCLKAGRGRNLNGQHGVTDMLTPQQLNDLVAFQNTLTTGTVVAEQRDLNAGELELKRAMVRFPRQPKKGKKKARKRTRGSFVVQGILRGSTAAVDPKADGVLFSIATPAGEQMAIVSHTLKVKGHGRRITGRARSSQGRIRVTLVRLSGGRYRFKATGKRVDMSELDSGNRDLMVAFEIGDATFAHSRNLVGKRNVFRISRKRR